MMLIERRVKCSECDETITVEKKDFHGSMTDIVADHNWTFRSKRISKKSVRDYPVCPKCVSATDSEKGKENE